MVVAAWLAMDPRAERRLTSTGNGTIATAAVATWFATWLWRLSRR
jgi:hypothetical protein